MHLFLLFLYFLQLYFYTIFHSVWLLENTLYMLFCSFVFNDSIFGNILSVTMILTINTACDPYGIALYNDSKLIDQACPLSGQRLSETLLDHVQKIMSPFGGLRAISGIAIAKGPGRYTAMRIGATTLKTVSQVFDIPIKGFCSLSNSLTSFDSYDQM